LTRKKSSRRLFDGIWRTLPFVSRWKVFVRHIAEFFMPQTPHIEKHFTAGNTVRDIVIGMADGLTVPFALAAGLTGAIASSRIVLTAGFAEIAAGSIAMGLGGYLAARSDAEHYAAERKREEEEVAAVPDVEAQEVQEIFKTYGLDETESAAVVEALRQRPQDWVDFMMRFELGLEKPEPGRALKSALTIALSYVVGGIIPLSAYLIFADAHRALNVSIAVTLVALLVFGAVKGRFTGAPMLRSGLQTALIGGLAAASAFAIARLIV
jgi:VIT1/CCC1 family predicted Fe2+/Mn2+ transporter